MEGGREAKRKKGAHTWVGAKRKRDQSLTAFRFLVPIPPLGSDHSLAKSSLPPFMTQHSAFVSAGLDGF